MRLILGIIIGAALTVGIAYFHDSRLEGPFAATQRLVNWENVEVAANSVYDNARNQFRELTGK